MDTKTHSHHAWLQKPTPDHAVQFYPDEEALITPLAKFIGTGIENKEICIVIATSQHVQLLNQTLDYNKVDTESAQISNHYLVFDAATTLNSFMLKGLPDARLFNEIIGSIVAKASSTGKPIRAYGEMVALLWKQNNPQAVIKLEELWNQLAEQYAFSLYCAYPELHFDMDIHDEAIRQISHTHSLLMPGY